MTKQALHKIENFVKVALDEIATLKTELSNMQDKLAQDSEKNNLLNGALKQAADAMYNADFLTDPDAKAEFIKKATADTFS